MSIPDAGWLVIEGRERPMHVGGLQLFRPPDDAGPDFLPTLAARLREDHEVRPPFNQRLARPYGLAGGVFRWVEDEVDLDYHFRHLALPEPGRLRELFAIVSRLHASLLDRHRPLWECYLIEGIEDGRFAAYTKIHHSMLDGVAAMRQLVRAFSDDPAERDLPPPWAASRDGRGSPSDDGPTGAMALPGRLLRLAAGEMTSGLSVARTVTTQLLRSRVDEATVAPFQAPNSMLNVRLSGARRFVAQSYELDRIRAVGRLLGATVNDVILAMCSGALRDYLLDHDALPDKPLIALVPVSFRAPEDSDAGNSISLVPANLATHLEDPLARLDLIRSSMNAVKDRLRDMSPRDLVNYGLVMTAPLILGQLSGASGRFRPTYNLVISNVPGPERSLYWNGARMEGLYPLSLLNEGYALNITMTSYAGSMDVGITADRKALPSVQRLIDHLEDALADLEHAAGIGS
ncbi:MAG: wax ester/triacylglycerol synthase family O-acyltransferase [Actinobacteria bacterium]|nr:wax ester/triacylglycerol synthase family O-acyltransferase [Actinomycetota bacterium]